MATKPPPEVQRYPEDSIEAIAYKSVEDIPAREPNDRHRLGYHVWRWLSDKNSTTLDEQIESSRARLLISTAEAKRMILERLKELGVKLPQ